MKNKNDKLTKQLLNNWQKAHAQMLFNIAIAIIGVITLYGGLLTQSGKIKALGLIIVIVNILLMVINNRTKKQIQTNLEKLS